jgi:hypothetical protein
MASHLVLKIEHLFGQFREGHLFGLLLPPILAYLVVLAIDASHVAVAEEDRPRALAARDGGLLTMVSTNSRDYGQIAGMAKSALVIQTVDVAYPGTDVAGG